jgi:hypothetical protein
MLKENELKLKVSDERGNFRIITDLDKIKQIHNKLVNTRIAGDCFWSGINIVYKELNFQLII